jgi:hypothetical protein
MDKHKERFFLIGDYSPANEVRNHIMIMIHIIGDISHMCYISMINVKVLSIKVEKGRFVVVTDNLVRIGCLDRCNLIILHHTNDYITSIY